MVVIRLQRRGTKKRPHHRIVATDQLRAQSGRVLETLGFYNPAYEPPKFQLDESRMMFWVSSGARVSDAVASLVKKFKKISLAGAKR
jgi:small subunit ribosomal protein S16